MRMIMITEKELDLLFDHVKLQVQERCLHTTQEGSTTTKKAAIDEVQRCFVYHFEVMRSKLKE